MLCIKKRDEQTDGRTEGRMDGRTNNPEAICPSNFFEVGGIKTKGNNVYSGKGTHTVDPAQKKIQQDKS